MTDTTPTPAPAPSKVTYEHEVNVDATALKSVVSVRPNLGAELHDALTSRKLWALVIGLVTDYFAYSGGGLSKEAAVLGALGAISAYCVGQGLADNGNR